MQITSSYLSPVHTPRRASTAAPAALDTLGPAREAENVEAALRQLMAGPAKTTESRQFADSLGRVTNLALMISEKYMTEEMRSQVLDAYQTLFTRMEPDTRFTIVAATDRDRADVEALRAQAVNPERIQILEPGLEDLTVWARDMMVPKFFPDQPGQFAIMAQEPLHNWHLSDSKVPAMIADANSASIKLEPNNLVVTDGGDVMANSKESFAGYYSLAATENKLHVALKDKPFKQEVINFYEQRTGHRVVETPFHETFPFRFVPAIALDGTHITRMEENPDYQTPSLAQNEVSDAKMYDDLTVNLFTKALNRPVTVMGRDNPITEHVEEPATDHMDMGMTPIDDNTFLVGDPRLARELLGLPADSRNRDQAEDFDAYAQTLESKGYKVVRVPHMEPKVNGDPYLTYNNCLMERFEKDGQEVRRVFLPVHGVQATDDYAIKTWEGQGFEVIPMRLDKLSCDWGALRCISNWLERTPTA